MSRESDAVAALRNRLAKAESRFDFTRCHFEAHALLREFPGSVEGRLLLERIERSLRAQEPGQESTQEAPPPRAGSGSLWRAALRPLPWAVGLVVLTYIALHFLRRLLK